MNLTAIIAEITAGNIDPPWFWTLVILGSLALLAMTYLDIYRWSGRRRAWILFAVRAVGMAALLVALVKPAWRHVRERTEPPQVAVILDDSQSMSLPAPGAEGGATRYQQARRWLEESAAGRSLRETFDVHLFDAAGRARDDGAPSAEPSAEQTDLVRAMRAAAGHLRGRNAAGILLLSDGRDTTGRRNYLPLQDFPLPVFTMGFRLETGREGPAIDLAVRSVEAPPRTLVHNAVQVKVLVRKTGGPAVDVPIHVERAGTPLATRRVAFEEGAAEQQVALSFTPADPGDFVLTARVGSPEGERTAVNNTGLFRLRVEAQPIRVLYIEGTLRAEFTFLRRRLADDPDVALVTFARSAGPDQASASDVLAGSEVADPERLEKIDVVLLGDFEPRMLDPATYTALRQWVEKGGGLMVLGGYRTLSSDGLAQTPLAEALPVEPAGGGLQQIDHPFPLTLTADGRRHPALAVTGDMRRDADLWKGLPELQGLVAVGRAKPGATVLARHPEPNPNDPDGKGYVVLAAQPFGQGTVAVLTADTTWRWSRLPRLAGRPDTLYARFWSQMVRWLGHRDVDRDRTVLTVATPEASYDRGERVTVTVRRDPAAMIPGQEDAKTDLALAVTTPDGRTTALAPRREVADPNRWTADYFPDRGGRFTVSARLARANAGGEGEGTGAGRAADVANDQTEFLVRGSSIELEDPTPNAAVLARVARLTGGTYADLADPQAGAAVLAALPTAPRVVREVRTTQVWNSPGLFVVFLALVCAEWIARRRWRLV